MKTISSALLKEDCRSEFGSMSDPYDEVLFHSLLLVEIRRTERSRKAFLLMLINLGRLENYERDKVASRVVGTVFSASRETDLKGWYKSGSIIGIMFTEPNPGTDIACVQDKILDRVCGSIKRIIGPGRFGKLEIQLLVFPQDSLYDIDPDTKRNGSECKLPTAMSAKRKRLLAIKRALDLLGGSAAILLALPLLLVIAAAIKLSSPGPVLFRQERVGRLGKRFMFLKFRSMYVNNNCAAHREFMRRYMEGSGTGGEEKPVYKIACDPRVTPIGRWLRKTSLDELPQFINVLKGEMSLVGPRPPIPYEYEHYDIWHKRRVTEAMPGITGL